MDDTQRENWSQKKCTLAYKSQYSLGPQCLSDMFTPVSDVHGRNTRAAANCDLYVGGGGGETKKGTAKGFGYCMP